MPAVLLRPLRPRVPHLGRVSQPGPGRRPPDVLTRTGRPSTSPFKAVVLRPARTTTVAIPARLPRPVTVAVARALRPRSSAPRRSTPPLAPPPTTTTPVRVLLLFAARATTFDLPASRSTTFVLSAAR
jgi:hypothetical protein